MQTARSFLCQKPIFLMTSTSPKLYVFAGNNGSGKSTFRNLIIDRLGVSISIDADSIARSIDPVHPERYKVTAGKEAIRLARECIQERRTFSFETTLSGKSAIRTIQDAKVNGFEVTMFYVGLGDVRLNIGRVASRVQNGGHDIPTEDIIRRHQSSIQYLLSNLQLIDDLFVVDNSREQGEIVLEVSNGEIVSKCDLLPAWVEIISQQFP